MTGSWLHDDCVKGKFAEPDRVEELTRPIVPVNEDDPREAEAQDEELEYIEEVCIANDAGSPLQVQGDDHDAALGTEHEVGGYDPAT